MDATILTKPVRRGLLTAIILLLWALLSQYIYWIAVSSSNDMTLTVSTRRNRDINESSHNDIEQHLRALDALNVGCRQKYTRGAPIITWNYKWDSATNSTTNLIFKDDPDLFSKLSRCPDVEVYVPEHIRDFGYCEDSMAYVQYFKGWGMPSWIYNEQLEHNGTKYFYFDLCPRSPTLFLSIYWDDIPFQPYWPQSKQILFMPNIEMHDGHEKLFWKADIVLCRSKDCVMRFNKWYKQEGSPTNATVVYTRGVSSDATFAVRDLSDTLQGPFSKDISDKFLHTIGKSPHKGSTKIVDCWKTLKNPPPLQIFAHRDWVTEQDVANIPNVVLNKGELDALSFGRLLNEASIVLCPSSMEGYGHYINQARAAGALILTTDAPPMNELIGEDSGVLIRVDNYSPDSNMQLGGTYARKFGLRDVKPIRIEVNPAAVCEAVERVLSMNATERQRRARNARRHYEEDLLFFAKTMVYIKQLAMERYFKARAMLRFNNSS